MKFKPSKRIKKMYRKNNYGGSLKNLARALAEYHATSVEGLTAVVWMGNKRIKR